MQSSQKDLSTLTEPARMLVVSREPSALSALWAIGEANAWEMEITGSGLDALERVQAGNGPDLVLLDLARGDADGLHTLRWLRRVRPEVPIMLLSHSEDEQQKLEAMRLGAQDYLVEPIEAQQLELAIRRHLALAHDSYEPEFASEKVEQIGEDMFFVAASPVMGKLRAQAELLAQVDVPLLIVGENGSGKETIARLIHKLSLRSGFGLRKVNCAALPGDLLERELFGHEAGAFTGAMRARAGKFELSDKGTVLLDDITETSPTMQVRLVQMLQEKQLSRLGGDRLIPVDVRIIATTNGKLDLALSEKRLREDLYYRLSAFTVHVPPLRQRRDEIPLLLGHFMNRVARHYGLPTRAFSPRVLEACSAYSWPGNLRELENFVKRYLVLGDEEMALAELGRDLEAKSEHAHAGHAPETETEAEPVEEGNHAGLRSLVQSVKGEAERNAIAVALEQTGWNRKAAARLLRVSYRTLLYKIQQYHMTPPDSYVPFPLNSQGLKDHEEP